MAKSGGESLFRDETHKHFSKAKPYLSEFGNGNFSWIEGIQTCPVYYPTKDEFKDPLVYLSKIADEASQYGICKIVSPLVASVPAGIVLMKEKVGFKFTTRMQPLRMANWNDTDKIVFSKSGRMYTFREYEKMANKEFVRNFSSDANLPTKFMEEEFWCQLISSKSTSVEYACDVDGSAFSESTDDPLGSSKWNLKKISRHSKSMLRHLANPIPGVTDPMLYMGMLFSMFAWHVEDHYLYSLNYHHCGAPKTWYGVPGHAAHEFENVVRDHVYDREMLSNESEGAVYDLLMGKTTMFPPGLLSKFDVPVFKVVQYPGELVVTFPRAYHSGFSHGFNCGEAVNFAMIDWFPYGEAASKRYQFLSRESLLPQEELLCKEVMCLNSKKLLKNENQSSTQVKATGQLILKAAFVKLIRFQHQMIWFLRKLGAHTNVLIENNSLARCYLCKHPCYISYVICNCNPRPICLNHVTDIKKCECSGLRTVFIREDFMTMVSLAKKIDENEGILDEKLELPTTDYTEIDDSELERGLLDDPDFNHYDLYCHISLQNDPSVSKGASRESSSSCEPMGPAKHKDSTVSSVMHGDACAPNLHHKKDALLASTKGTVGISSKKSKGIYKSNEHPKNFSTSKKAKELNNYSVDSHSISANKNHEGSAQRLNDDPPEDCEKYQFQGGLYLHGSNERDPSLAKQYKKFEKNAKLSKLSRQKSGEVVPQTDQATRNKWEEDKLEKKTRLVSTPSGDQVILLSDILSAMKPEGSKLKIFEHWKRKLQSKGIDLKAYSIDTESIVEMDEIDAINKWGLSMKGCLQLKKILEDDEVPKLRELVKETFCKLYQGSSGTVQTAKMKSINEDAERKRKFTTTSQNGSVALCNESNAKDDAKVQERVLKKISKVNVREGQHAQTLPAETFQDHNRLKGIQNQADQKMSSSTKQKHKLPCEKSPNVIKDLHESNDKTRKHEEQKNKMRLQTIEDVNSHQISVSKDDATAKNQKVPVGSGSQHNSNAVANKKSLGKTKRRLDQRLEDNLENKKHRIGEGTTQLSKKSSEEQSIAIFHEGDSVLRIEKRGNKIKHDKDMAKSKNSSLSANSSCHILSANVAVGENTSLSPADTNKNAAINNDVDKVKWQIDEALGLMDIDIGEADFASEAGLSNLSFSSLDKSDRDTCPEDEEHWKGGNLYPLEHEANCFELDGQKYETCISGCKDKLESKGNKNDEPLDDNSYGCQNNMESGGFALVRRDNHKSCLSTDFSSLAPKINAMTSNEYDSQIQNKDYLSKNETDITKTFQTDKMAITQEKHSRSIRDSRIGFPDIEEAEKSNDHVNISFQWNHSASRYEGLKKGEKLESVAGMSYLKHELHDDVSMNVDEDSYVPEPVNPLNAACKTDFENNRVKESSFDQCKSSYKDLDVPYSPSSFGIDYYPDLEMSKSLKNDERYIPAELSENYDYQNVCSPQGSLEKMQNSKQKSVAQWSQSQTIPFCPQFTSNSSQPQTSLKGKHGWLDNQQWKIDYSDDDVPSHTNEVVRDKQTSVLGVSTEYSDIGYNMGGSSLDRVLTQGDCRFFDQKVKQIPSKKSEASSEADGTSSPEENNIQVALEEHYMPETIDKTGLQNSSGVVDDGYWPSFVTPRRQQQQEDDLKRQKLLIEKWGRV